MRQKNRRGQQIGAAAVALAILLLLLLVVLLYRTAVGATTINVSQETMDRAAGAIRAIDTQGANDLQTATAAASVSSVATLLASAQHTPDAAILSAEQLLLQGNTAVTGLYFFNSASVFVFGITTNQPHSVAAQRCAAGPFCTVVTMPNLSYVTTDSFRAHLSRALQPPIGHSMVLAFDRPSRTTRPFGTLFIFQPVRDANSSTPVGAIVATIDPTTLVLPYVGNAPVLHGVYLLDGPFALLPLQEMRTYLDHKQLPVTSVANLDPAVLGGLKPTLLRLSRSHDQVTFTVNGTPVQASSGPTSTTIAGLTALAFAPTGVAGSEALIPLLTAVLLLLLAACISLYLYFIRRLRLRDDQQAVITRSKSAQLTEDIVAVAQALSVARGGDLTVHIPDSESEVGLLSLSLNGLISDYSQIVGGIIQAAQGVQEGAARVDESVRRSVGVATGHAASVMSLTTTMQAVAASAVDVQQATVTATGLAANAQAAVRSGQDSVARIADAVDAIKQAAIGTTREFKRLQEDSVRLTALVAAVKNNAESLDLQAANAALEARHLGTESGTEFAASIGRLARQAQDTLDDAEAAVRSVIASIDEVNRRIERISEQVRRGVEEVRQVRTTFVEITTTNTSLVQFIDSVADSAGIQAQSAQAATAAITDIARVFEQFRDQLTATGDEVANMRLIVASLRASVANLKVDSATLPKHSPVGTETAA
jgi:methyl-accepting chemotaxis protein